jgi:hypothetical protein
MLLPPRPAAGPRRPCALARGGRVLGFAVPGQVLSSGAMETAFRSTSLRQCSLMVGPKALMGHGPLLCLHGDGGVRREAGDTPFMT